MHKVLTTFFVSLLFLVNSSCTKEDLLPENNVFHHLSKVKEVVYFDGQNNLIGNTPITGFIEINEEKTEATGSLFVNNEKVQDFLINLGKEHLEQIKINEKDENTYGYENMIEGAPIKVSGLEDNLNRTIGKIHLGSTDIKFTVLRENGTELRVFPPVVIAWAVVAAVASVTTVVTCAVERTIARETCQIQYDECNSKCPEVCLYTYNSGACGGTCEISCPQK